MLTLRLHPKILLLPARAEFQTKDPSICRRPYILGAGFFDEGRESGVAGDGDEVEVGVCGRGAAGAPAEVDEVVFAVEVEVAWGRLGGDFAAGEGAAAGFEGY